MGRSHEQNKNPLESIYKARNVKDVIVPDHKNNVALSPSPFVLPLSFGIGVTDTRHTPKLHGDK
jgi:hypothetical protein